MDQDQVQIRYISGEIRNLASVREAVEMCKHDKTIFKISFSVDGEHMRWRPKRKRDRWENEDCLENLSSAYKAEVDRRALFFVLQDLLPANNVFQSILKLQMDGEITEEEAERRMDRACIRKVMTETAFWNKYA